jgi:hypothetical protein
MDEIISSILQSSHQIALEYGLSFEIFFIVYLLSIPPFYAGYFMMAYGTTRNLTIKEVLRLQFLHKVRWHPKATLGLIVHLVGRVMPYVYVLTYGTNLPSWVYWVTVLLFVIPLGFFVRHFFKKRRTPTLIPDVEVVRKVSVTDTEEVEHLWQIYDKTFSKVNKRSPCRQSLDHDEFVSKLQNSRVSIYLITSPTTGPVGLALITNDFSNAPWISREYFSEEYPEEYDSGRIYYFIGIAIDPAYRSSRLSLLLIEHIIDDIPHDAIMGFDHSKNINPMLHHFTSVVRQARSLRRSHIEQQHYHIVRRV